MAQGTKGQTEGDVRLGWCQTEKQIEGWKQDQQRLGRIFADLIIMVRATDVSEYLTFTFLGLGWKEAGQKSDRRTV